MPYATVTDLQDRLGEPRLAQLTDLDDPPLGMVNASVAQKALDDAEAEIDGYLVGRYALPMASAPAVLRVHACTIAHYRLLGAQADEATRKDYEGVLKYLQAVAEGKVLLMSPDQAVTPPGAGTVMFSTSDKVMGRAAYTGEG